MGEDYDSIVAREERNWQRAMREERERDRLHARVAKLEELARLVRQAVRVSERGAPGYLRIISLHLFPPESWDRLVELAEEVHDGCGD